MSIVLPLLLEELPLLGAAAPPLVVVVLVLLLLPHAAMASAAPTTSNPVGALPRTNLITTSCAVRPATGDGAE